MRTEPCVNAQRTMRAAKGVRVMQTCVLWLLRVPGQWCADVCGWCAAACMLVSIGKGRASRAAAPAGTTHRAGSGAIVICSFWTASSDAWTTESLTIGLLALGRPLSHLFTADSCTIKAHQSFERMTRTAAPHSPPSTNQS